MKKTYKALLCGAAAVAAVGIAYAMDERFFEKAKDKLTVFKCRANSKIMEQALPLTDAMFPGPKVVSGADSAKKIPEVLKELNVNKVMIVTGPTVGRTIVPPIAENLERHGIGYTIYDQVEANPSVKTVEAMAAGDYPLQEQVGLLAGREPKHAPKIFKEDMKVDWTLGLDMIYNRIRGLSPFPTAWTELKNKKTGETVSLKIFVTERIPKEYTGDVTLATDNKTFLDVLVKGGAIRIKELQLSGKKRMKTDEFLRGFHVEDYTL